MYNESAMQSEIAHSADEWVGGVGRERKVMKDNHDLVQEPWIQDVPSIAAANSYSDLISVEIKVK